MWLSGVLWCMWTIQSTILPQNIRKPKWAEGVTQRMSANMLTPLGLDPQYWKNPNIVLVCSLNLF